MMVRALSLIFLFLPLVAAADIVAWEDAAGVKHYTNLKEEVPEKHRESAFVVVDEVARQRPAAPAAGTEPPISGGPPAEEPPRRQAQVVYDRSDVSNAYLDGLLRGLEAARAVRGGTGGNVHISGPLAVANARSRPSYHVPYRYPLITTSFDRGRSRHLTLRMLLQDQFALDRAAPYVFWERFIPPLGHPRRSVDLNPFLPRGLPHGFPRRPRVVVR